jgi:ethanolamine ammonia-lyase small subunit
MAVGPPVSWPALRRATPARIGIGRTGASLPTSAHLDFQLAHARARDAVYAALDTTRILSDLAAIGLEAVHLRSAAAVRAAYLRRPDLGRRLDDGSRRLLQQRPPASPEVVFVVADGLSATAVNAHAVALLKAVLDGSSEDLRRRLGPVAVVDGGRVAIGDEIGGLLGADLVAVLIGERPGLSAADSLGIYVTWQPAPGTVDAARNCLSNIRPEGMPIAAGAEALRQLIAGAFRHRMTGVSLSRHLAQLHGLGAIAPCG